MRIVRRPMQILKKLWTGDSETSEMKNTYQYTIELKVRLEETCQLARESLKQSQYKHHNDKTARQCSLNVGMKVLLLLPNDHNKLLLQWKGP